MPGAWSAKATSKAFNRGFAGGGGPSRVLFDLARTRYQIEASIPLLRSYSVKLEHSASLRQRNRFHTIGTGTLSRKTVHRTQLQASVQRGRRELATGKAGIQTRTVTRVQAKAGLSRKTVKRVQGRARLKRHKRSRAQMGRAELDDLDLLVLADE